MFTFSVPISLVTFCAVFCGIALDLLLGDPQNPWHPVRLIGNAIAWGINVYNKISFTNKLFSFLYGMLLTFTVVTLSYLSVVVLLYLAYRLHFIIGFLLETALCYFVIAAKALYTESMKVYQALVQDDLPLAQRNLSHIVGRDTDNLDESGLVRGAVETIAENFSDGAVAPLFYLLLGGPPLALAYKTVNTLDSMIGYNNDTYRYLGKFAARVDDLVNLVPARLAALLMLLATLSPRFNFKNAMRIFIRDRYQHKSPNSAQTEAVCAGALGIILGGVNYYHGVPVAKPTIGDPLREPQVEDIRRANRLMWMSYLLAVLLGAIVFWMRSNV